MIAFEIWGKFATFRDPFTISQNITLPIPPKSTVAGMMASILGSTDYLSDQAYKNFSYSVVTLGQIRKKSFSQNYINDYTKKSLTQLNHLKKGLFSGVAKGFRDSKAPQKPINRELLIDPKFLILVENFAYEKILADLMKERITRFPFYLGNSEFAGNFKWLDIQSVERIKKEKCEIDSFVSAKEIENIIFHPNSRYTPLSFASALDENRSPLSKVEIIYSDNPIEMREVEVLEVVIDERVFRCKMVS